jgi:hypothetical protein
VLFAITAIYSLTFSAVEVIKRSSQIDRIPERRVVKVLTWDSADKPFDTERDADGVRDS